MVLLWGLVMYDSLLGTTNYRILYKIQNPMALFIDASFERNTRSFQRSQQKSKTRTLTLGEVSQEIHHLKKDIVSLN